jgi:hypothetical protein
MEISSTKLNDLSDLIKLPIYCKLTGRCLRSARKDAKTLGFGVKIGKEYYIVKSKFLAYLEGKNTKTA